MFSNFSDEKLARFFLGENPQVSSLVFSKISAGKVAAILKFFPIDLRADILNRMENIEPVKRAVIDKIFCIIFQELSSFVEVDFEKIGGIDFVDKVKKELAG